MLHSNPAVLSIINAALSMPIQEQWIPEDSMTFLARVCQAWDCLVPLVSSTTTDREATEATDAAGLAAHVPKGINTVSVVVADVPPPQPPLDISGTDVSTPAQQSSMLGPQPTRQECIQPTTISPAMEKCAPYLHATTSSQMAQALYAFTQDSCRLYTLSSVRSDGFNHLSSRLATVTVTVTVYLF